jgi:hypothetical protein
MRSRTPLLAVIRFGMWFGIVDYLDHHRLCVKRLDYAFHGRRLCLSGKVDNGVGRRSVGLDLGNGRWEELEGAPVGGHCRDRQANGSLKGRLMRRGSSGGEWGQRTPALINRSKGTATFQVAEDEKKGRLEYRASVDFVRHEGKKYRKDLEVGWGPSRVASDILRASTPAVRESTAKLITLRIPYIGRFLQLDKYYSRVDEDLCWKMGKTRKWEALIGGPTRWEIELPVGLGCDRGRDWGPGAAQMQCLGTHHMLHNLF